MISSLFNILQADLAANARRLILFVPVAIGTGIGIFFLLPEEPSYTFAASFLLASVTGLLVNYRRSTGLRLFFATLVCISAGFSAAVIRTQNINVDKLLYTTPPVWLEGVVESISPMDPGYRLVISNANILTFKKGNGSEERRIESIGNVRLTVRTQTAALEPGRKIRVRAILSPPRRPSFPGGYDDERTSFFTQIAASGFAISDVKQLPDTASSGFSQYVQSIRNTANERILAETEKPYTGIIAALLTGERNQIKREDREALFQSGLGHVLSISGLHMTIVGGWCFFTLRFLLALFPYIALRFDIKKISAIGALVGSLLYLLLADAPVPAVRSYVMLAFIFLAIILDRTPVSMRPVAIAATLILLVQPESLLSPSFQMSFAAVIAIIALWETMTKYLHTERRPAWWRRYILYLGTSIMTSVVASIATAPYVIYHFGRSTHYVGLLANVIGVPIASFLVMPFGMLGLLVMPFGLSEYPFALMEITLGWFMDWARLMANLPYAEIKIPSFSTLGLALISLGGLWLCIFQTPVRYIGIVIMVAGTMFGIGGDQKPDIVMDGSGKLFAVKDAENQYYFSSLTSARSARVTWMTKLGVDEALKLYPKQKSDKPHTHALPECYSDWCSFTGNHKNAFIWMPDTEIPEYLKQNACKASLVITARLDAMTCDSANLIQITAKDLAREGTHVISFKQEKVIIETVAASRGKRMWTER